MSKKTIKTTKFKGTPMDEIDFSTTWYQEIYYWFWRRWDWIVGRPREIKWFCQRGKRGWADCDAWDVGGYLIEWMPDIIKQLRKNVSGCPGDVFDNTRKRNQCWKWKKILKEIEDGFRAADDIGQDKCINKNYTFNKKKYDKLNSKFQKGGKLFIKHFFSLWD